MMREGLITVSPLKHLQNSYNLQCFSLETSFAGNLERRSAGKAA
jgi:hypothetical protein